MSHQPLKHIATLGLGHWGAWLPCSTHFLPSGFSAAIFEVGGVPYSVLEPVLERCTPDQLYRIEECNHVSVLSEAGQLPGCVSSSFVSGSAMAKGQGRGQITVLGMFALDLCL